MVKERKSKFLLGDRSEAAQHPIVQVCALTTSSLIFELIVENIKKLIRIKHKQ